MCIYRSKLNKVLALARELEISVEQTKRIFSTFRESSCFNATNISVYGAEDGGYPIRIESPITGNGPWTISYRPV